jgi:hypothetical protein
MRLTEACSCPVYGGKTLRRQHGRLQRGIGMMRADIVKHEKAAGLIGPLRVV